MNVLTITLIVFFGLALIGGILLQPGSKGGGLGATFGGGGANSAFGAQGAAPMLAKATFWLAGAFFATTVIIEVLIVRENRSALEKLGSRPAVTTPAPAQTPAQNPTPAPAPAPAKK